MKRKWDVMLAELEDALELSRMKSKRPCRYCGALTTATSGICLAHSDLPSLDPHTNVRAGQFQRPPL